MKRLILCLMGMIMLASCGPNREKQLRNIEEHEEALSTVDRLAEDSEVDALLSLYRSFAADFPDDSLAPVFLMRAADINISLGHTDEAITLLDTVIDLYPGFEDLGGCWFLKGYAFECAEQFDSARNVYTYFVDNYPEHDLASDTRKTLPYLGMSAEEMLEAILNSSHEEESKKNESPVVPHSRQLS